MTDPQTPATDELCRFCHKPFNGKSHKHGVRYLSRPLGPPPPPTSPHPMRAEAIYIDPAELEAYEQGRADERERLAAAVRDAWEEWGDLTITDSQGVQVDGIPADARKLVAAVLALLQPDTAEEPR